MYLDIVVLAVLAVILVVKLKSVLGKQFEDEKPDYKQQNGFMGGCGSCQVQDITSGVLVKTPEESGVKEVGPEFYEKYLNVSVDDILDAKRKVAFDSIKKQYPSLDAMDLVRESRANFQNILSRYSKKDLGHVRDILNKDVYEIFAESLQNESDAGISTHIIVVKIFSSKVVGIKLKNTVLDMSVEFLSEQIIFSQDSDGNIVNGDQEYPKLVKEVWLFKKNLILNDNKMVLYKVESSGAN